MYAIFDLVPAHIILSISIAFVCLILELLDSLDILPKNRQRGNVILWESKVDQDDSTEFLMPSHKDVKKKPSEKIREIHIKITIFSMCYTIIALNVQTLGHYLFNVEFGSIEGIAISFPMAFFVTWVAKDLIENSEKL